jgi:hypothetical protein
MKSGVVVQGGPLHVRGGRSGSIGVLNLPPSTAAPVSEAAPPAAREDSGSLERDDAWSAGLVARLEIDSREIRAGEPIVLRIVLRNATADRIGVPATLVSGDLSLRITRDGKPVPLTGRVQVRPSSTFELAPGATRAYRVVLESFAAELATPGRYTIELVGLGPVALAAPFGRCTLGIR